MNHHILSLNRTPNVHRIAVEWAYPSSTHAAKFGFPKSGCWVVYRGIEALSGHYGRAEADAEARRLVNA